MLGLRFCARAFSSCGKWGPLLITVRGPLTIAAPLVAERRLQTRRLSNCGPRAQPLRGMWDLPRPGLEPVSPELAGRFSTTAPPGKPPTFSFFLIYLFIFGCVGSLFLCEGFLQLWQAGPPFIAVRRPLTIAAPLVAERRLQTRRLSSCGSRAQSLRSMWDPLRPGLEPMSSALAGRFSTTAPPGKPYHCF